MKKEGTFLLTLSKKRKRPQVEIRFTLQKLRKELRFYFPEMNTLFNQVALFYCPRYDMREARLPVKGSYQIKNFPIYPAMAEYQL